MPPPRRQAAPKSESKAGLVVALIFFILMTIVLGVVAYMGFDGQKKFEDAAATATGEKNKAMDAEREQRAKYLAYVHVTGAAGAPTGDSLGGLAGNPAFSKEIGEILKTFAPYGVKWDPQSKTDQPQESIPDARRCSRKRPR